jgi:hypothetical protein
VTPFECKYQIVSVTPLVFVDVGEDLGMVDDVVTPSNPLIAPIEAKELEKTPLDVNVFQWSCKKEPFRRVVHTQTDYLAWDHRFSPNPHALTIYLKFVPTRGAMP